MVTYGSQTTRVFARESLASVTIGGNTYALANYIEAMWGYDISETDVLGDNYPLQGTGHFRGHIIIRRVYSTDADLLTIQAPSSGMTPETTITVPLTDTGTPTTKTWTIKARLSQINKRIGVTDFVIAEIEGPMTTVPTVA